MNFMYKIFKIICSNHLMALLFIVFATAMGIATFIENDYGTQTAKALVYNTWWFEAIMFLFVVNFLGNIFRYRLYRKQKWPVLLFHLAFLLILTGAFISRYIGHEGIMPIKEGESTDLYLSEKIYLQVIIDDNKEQRTFAEPVLFSAKGDNDYILDTDFRGQEVHIKLLDYIPNVSSTFEKTNQGQTYLHFVESGSGKRHDHYIKKGTLKNIHGMLIGFNYPKNTTINFVQEKDTLKMYSQVEGTFFRMADRLQGKVIKQKLAPLRYLTLHTIGNLNFVISQPPIKGKIKYISADRQTHREDMLLLQVQSTSFKKMVRVKGGQYTTNPPVRCSLGGLNFRVTYGAKQLRLPFKIKLRDFLLERYPGSESASSYNSEVTVEDSEETFDYKIYMNHILNYKGYRFFQSSYDITPQYEETRLSVNYDYLGTMFTYVGYFMLYIGLMAIFFAKNTRFGLLKEQLKKVRKQKSKLLIGLFFVFNVVWGQKKIPTHDHEHSKDSIPSLTQNATDNTAVKRLNIKQIDSVLNSIVASKIHAEKFSSLIIQDAGGRMKPVHTFASEFLRKISKKDTYRGFDANQILLSTIQNPFVWYDIPIIYLEKNNREKICSVLGLENKKYAALFDFIDSQGNYKIRDWVAAIQKKQIQSKLEKDLIQIDRRVGLLYSTISGEVLRLFPIPNDPQNKWVAQTHLGSANFKGIDSVFVKQILPVYLQKLFIAKRKSDYKQADQILEGIRNFQKKYGQEVYPTESKIKWEIVYNKCDVFRKLFSYDLYVSLLLLVLIVWQIFKNKKWLRYAIKIGIGFVIFLFVLHTLGLVARAFISGHAPWSDAYESIIYVAWATLFFGLVFGRKSSLTIASTTFLTGIILMVAHWNWMDPQIANLPPVLNSYWLMIHVAVIVGSYGPFALSMTLGIVVLSLYIFTRKNNQKQMDLHIRELTIINEMSMTLGLVMLAIGNFLGGMWANESWGRYWGWDPKETWALISIMVYAFVLHLRLIPKWRGRFLFNVLSIYAFASIMMTYFGVNFYLSGKHSYATGEQIVTPAFVYYSVGIITVLVLVASIQNKKYFLKI